MKKHIIISIIFVSISILMAVGIIAIEWWPVLVGIALQVAISVIIDWRKKKPEPKPAPGCRHLFDANRVLDLNDDPPCLVCGKYFLLITMQEWVKVTPVTDQDTWVTLEPRDKLYKTVPRNDGQRQQPTV